MTWRGDRASSCGELVWSVLRYSRPQREGWTGGSWIVCLVNLLTDELPHRALLKPLNSRFMINGGCDGLLHGGPLYVTLGNGVRDGLCLWFFIEKKNVFLTMSLFHSPCTYLLWRYTSWVSLIRLSYYKNYPGKWFARGNHDWEKKQAEEEDLLFCRNW